MENLGEQCCEHLGHGIDTGVTIAGSALVVLIATILSACLGYL